jgi:hypothetical protein
MVRDGRVIAQRGVGRGHVLDPTVVGLRRLIDQCGYERGASQPIVGLGTSMLWLDLGLDVKKDIALC